MALLVATALLVGGCSNHGGNTSGEEPAHHVRYFVSTIGTANSDLTIGYSDGDGTAANDTTPGFAPIWSKDVTTQVGLAQVLLDASGTSSDLNFRVVCSINVDGVTKTSRGSFACNLVVDFQQIRGELVSHSAHPSPSALPSSSGPTHSALAIPDGCRFVSMDEATSILADQTGGTIKPVLSWSGSADGCTYVFDQNQTRVTFAWEPGEKADTLPGTRVSGLGFPAYWADFGSFAKLDVQLPKGLFSVTISALMLRIDKKATAIAFFRTARSRIG